MPIVYVVQEHHKELTKAAAYGQICLLLPASAQVWYDPEPHIAKMRLGLANATSDDHLLLMGDPALIGVATAIMSDVTGGKFKLLKFSRRDDLYVSIPVCLKGERCDDEEEFLAQRSDSRRSGGTAY